jgi:hypothetical protein
MSILREKTSSVCFFLFPHVDLCDGSACLKHSILLESLFFAIGSGGQIHGFLTVAFKSGAGEFL